MVPLETLSLTLEDARRIDAIIDLLRLRYAAAFLKNLHGLLVLGQKDALIKLLIHEIGATGTTNPYITITILRDKGIVAVKKEWNRSKIRLTPHGEKIAKFLSDAEKDRRKKFLEEILSLKAVGGHRNYDIAILILVTQRYFSEKRPLYSTIDLCEQLKKTKGRVSQVCTRLVNAGFLVRVNEKLGYRNITYKPTSKAVQLLRLFEEHVKAF